MPTPPPVDPRDFLPLSPQVFQILLSLLDEPRHGYAIITDVRDRTNGEIRLTASTLYDALARLLDQTLLDEVDEAPAPAARRRCYRLTTLGRETAREEARRLERMLATARDKRLLPDTRGKGRH